MLSDGVVDHRRQTLSKKRSCAGLVCGAPAGHMVDSRVAHQDPQARTRRDENDSGVSRRDLALFSQDYNQGWYNAASEEAVDANRRNSGAMRTFLGQLVTTGQSASHTTLGTDPQPTRGVIRRSDHDDDMIMKISRRSDVSFFQFPPCLIGWWNDHR
jgi:hypothetical protein